MQLAQAYAFIIMRYVDIVAIKLNGDNSLEFSNGSYSVSSASLRSSTCMADFGAASFGPDWRRKKDIL